MSEPKSHRETEPDRPRSSLAEPRLVKWSDAAVADFAIEPGAACVWLVDLDAGVSPEDAETAEPASFELNVLDDTERVRAARFLRARDRRRFARCRASLRRILGGVLGQSPEAVRLRAGGRGKPEIDVAEPLAAVVMGQAEVRFNVSHSSELALIAVCRGDELGVDLEKVRPINEAVRIVESFFSPSENAYFATMPTATRDYDFCRGWTRKEAVLKGMGVGLAGLAVKLETGFGQGELPDRFVPACPPPRLEEWRLWEATPRPGFVAALAIRDPTAKGPATIEP